MRHTSLILIAMVLALLAFDQAMAKGKKTSTPVYTLVGIGTAGDPLIGTDWITVIGKHQTPVSIDIGNDPYDCTLCSNTPNPEPSKAKGRECDQETKYTPSSTFKLVPSMALNPGNAKESRIPLTHFFKTDQPNPGERYKYIQKMEAYPCKDLGGNSYYKYCLCEDNTCSC